MLADDLTTISTLKSVLQTARLIQGNDGLVYARLTRDDRQVTYPTTSPEFMTWFWGEAAPQFLSLPSTKLMRQAIRETEDELRSEDISFPVAARVYADENSVVVDLGDGTALEIEAAGTAQDCFTGVVFPTLTTTQRLPKPQSANALEVLPGMLDLSEAQGQIALIWLMSLFQADGRFPILIITGPQQSGKTRLARDIRRIVDPHPLPLLPLPKSRDELKRAILENAILAFDRVGKIPTGIVDDLLALAEGTILTLPGRSTAALYKRPTILVCEDLPDAPDLLENAIVLRLKERSATNFKNKLTLDRLFDQHHAKAFGSLVKLCSQALRQRKAVELDTPLKDADLERWIMALDKGFSLENKLMTAFANNIENTLSSIINERPAVAAFRALVRAQGAVTATATELLDLIEPFLDGPKDARYPTSGKGLAKLLRDHKRFMTDIDIEFDVRTGKDRDRNIVASWQSRQVPGESARTTARATVKSKARASVAAKPMEDAKSPEQPMLW